MPIIYGQVGGVKHYAKQPEYTPKAKGPAKQARQRGKYWEDWEIALLVDPSKKLSEVARETGRTEDQCRHKAWEINVSFAGRE